MLSYLSHHFNGLQLRDCRADDRLQRSQRQSSQLTRARATHLPFSTNLLAIAFATADCSPNFFLLAPEYSNFSKHMLHVLHLCHRQFTHIHMCSTSCSEQSLNVARSRNVYITFAYQQIFKCFLFFGNNQRYSPLVSCSSQPNAVSCGMWVVGLAPVLDRVRARLIKLADSADCIRSLSQMLQICILRASHRSSFLLFFLYLIQLS